jgi:putative addiction module component (TIGR02574 family)
MSPRAAKVLEEALQLPKEERRRVASALQESLQDDEAEDLSPEWKDEIVRRVAAFERGELESVDGEEVFARIRTKYAG